MGCVIRMNSKTLIKKFLSEYDPKDFQFILISENITTEKRYKNVMAIPALIPPPNIIATFINEGMDKSYKKKYMEYLKKDEVNSLIAIIVKAALQGMNLVLVCSVSEDEYEYLKLLCEFIEEEYKLKTFSFKKFAEDPKKAVKIKNKEEVVGILVKKMEKLHEVGGKLLNPEVNKEKFLKKLKKLDEKELYKYCKSKGLKVDKDMSKKDLIKKVKKKLFKD